MGHGRVGPWSFKDGRGGPWAMDGSVHGALRWSRRSMGHGRVGPWSLKDGRGGPWAMDGSVHGALKMVEAVHGPWTGRSMETFC
jgi:hypothetical protein